MKKFFTVLISLAVVLAFTAPVVTAQVDPDAAGATACEIDDTGRISAGTNLSCSNPCDFTDNADCGVCCMLNIIYRITDWIFFILIALAVLFVIIAGFMFVTSGGSPEKTLAARNYLIYAAIGVAVALIARAVPAIVKAITGLQ